MAERTTITTDLVSEGRSFKPGVVTIIMATYNRAATLTRAVGSVLRQDYEKWELIIVDDGSTDETEDVLEEFDDPRIVVVRHDHNRGVTAAKNTGLDRIAGEWFTFVDSDDEILPNSLSAMLAVVARHPDVTAVTCNCRDTLTGGESGTGLHNDGYVDFETVAKAGGAHWGITRTTLLGPLRFDERIPGSEGVLWLKISARARRYYLDQPLKIYHKEGDDRVSRKNRDPATHRAARLPLIDDEEYLELLKWGNRARYSQTVFQICWACVDVHRKADAWRFYRRYSGSRSRKVFLFFACLLGPRWTSLFARLRSMTHGDGRRDPETQT